MLSNTGLGCGSPMQEQKKRVFHMEEDVMRVKFSYTEALHNLEQISDQMHQSRLPQSSSGSSELGGDMSSGGSDAGSSRDSSSFPRRLVKSSSLSSSEVCVRKMQIMTLLSMQKL